MLTAVSALAVALVTAAGGIITTVIGRRQPRRPRGADRRDDFTAVTDKLSAHIERLEREAEQDRQQAEQDRARISSQDFALRYIASWARSLVGYMRQAHLEPPPPPQPIPDEVRPYLHDIGT
jgi:GAF domain-containing protein